MTDDTGEVTGGVVGLRTPGRAAWTPTCPRPPSPVPSPQGSSHPVQMYACCMVTKTRITLAEFLALPDERPSLELIDGEVCRKPVGKRKHSLATRRFTRHLEDSPATRDGEVLPELGMHWWGHARSDHRVPDVSYFRAGRKFTGDYPQEPPDLVAEVRSEGQTRESQESRLAFLRARGVPITVLIDPEDETVTVWEQGRAWTVARDGVVTIESLNGFSFAVASLFD